ncbi:MAG: divalent-cation tolerance protein CutA [Terracidiphilus sp.]
MLENASAVRIVVTTVVSPEEGARMGRALVEERLAACATLLTGAQSIYRWQGQIESSAETVLLLKTEMDRLAALDTRLHELHSYQVPEFLVLTVESGSHPYLAWLHACLHEST